MKRINIVMQGIRDERTRRFSEIFKDEEEYPGNLFLSELFKPGLKKYKCRN